MARTWRLVPRVRYVNYHKEFPQAADCWKEWFSVNRYWSGRIVHVGIRARALVFDFRRDWIADMKDPTRLQGRGRVMAERVSCTKCGTTVDRPVPSTWFQYLTDAQVAEVSNDPLPEVTPYDGAWLCAKCGESAGWGA